jgi:hypothetical protein
MMVARHEMPGERVDMIRPVGNGMIRGGRFSPVPKRIQRPYQSIIPYPTGRILVGNAPRHFMPGYHRLVPPGRCTCVLMLTSSGLQDASRKRPIS